MSEPVQGRSKNEAELKSAPVWKRPWLWGGALVTAVVLVISSSVLFKMYPGLTLGDVLNSDLSTAIGEHQNKAALYDDKRKLDIERLEKMSAEDIIIDPEALKLATEYTNKLFREKCATCHGMNGQGVAGSFPVLSDTDWLYGGTISDIAETITNGRQGMMPAHEGTVSIADIDKLANFVISLSKGQADPSGWDVYKRAGCSGCHGLDAKGNKFVGSANLTDSIWRFGGSKEQVLRTITAGVNQQGVMNTRFAVMPGWTGRLSPVEIKLLAVRIWGLGGGRHE